MNSVPGVMQLESNLLPSVSGGNSTPFPMNHKLSVGVDGSSNIDVPSISARERSADSRFSFASKADRNLRDRC